MRRLVTEMEAEQKLHTSLLTRAGVAYDTLERFLRYSVEVIQSSQIFQASTRLLQIWFNSTMSANTF